MSTPNQWRMSVHVVWYEYSCTSRPNLSQLFRGIPIISHLFFSISKAMIPKLRMWASDSGTTRIEMTKCQDTLRVITLKTWKGIRKSHPALRIEKLQVDLRKALNRQEFAIDELRMTRTSPVDVKMTGTEKEWQQWVGNSGDSGDSGQGVTDSRLHQRLHDATCSRNMSKRLNMREQYEQSWTWPSRPQRRNGCRTRCREEGRTPATFL